MGNNKNDLGGFDVGRITKVGWLVIVLAMIVFGAVTGVATSVFEIKVNNENPRRGPIAIVAIIAVGIAAGFFKLSQRAFANKGIVLIRPKPDPNKEG